MQRVCSAQGRGPAPETAIRVQEIPLLQGELLKGWGHVVPVGEKNGFRLMGLELVGSDLEAQRRCELGFAPAADGHGLIRSGKKGRRCDRMHLRDKTGQQDAGIEVEGETHSCSRMRRINSTDVVD